MPETVQVQRLPPLHAFSVQIIQQQHSTQTSQLNRTESEKTPAILYIAQSQSEYNEMLVQKNPPDNATMTNNWKVNDVVMLNSKQFTNGTNKLQHVL